MESLKKQIFSKENAELKNLINLSANIDETSIKFHGTRKHKFSKILDDSLQMTLALETKITDEIKELGGLSGKKYRYLINNIISSMKSPKYLEIGSWMGSTACSAIYENELKITCIDNWSEFLTKVDNPKKIFEKNINNYLTEKIDFNLLNKDFREVNYNSIGPHNIFLFDGPHNFKDHIDGVIMPQPALDSEYILIVDDWNWKQVRDGTYKAIEDLNSVVLAQLEIRTTHDDTSAVFQGRCSDWHQGYSFFVIKK